MVDAPLNDAHRTFDIWGMPVFPMRSKWGIDLVWGQLRQFPSLLEYQDPKEGTLPL